MLKPEHYPVRFCLFRRTPTNPAHQHMQILDYQRMFTKPQKIMLNKEIQMILVNHDRETDLHIESQVASHSWFMEIDEYGFIYLILMNDTLSENAAFYDLFKQIKKTVQQRPELFKNATTQTPVGLVARGVVAMPRCSFVRVY